LNIADIGERALIERIRLRAGSPPGSVTLGIGDDAAVIEPVRGRHDVLTTDSLVEDVHFRLSWSSTHVVGRKAVLINLSDLAAMGARPSALLLGLCLPAALSLSDFDALIDGVALEARASGAALIGGNISRSPGPLIVTITALGYVHPRRVLSRSGGRHGDELYVTGTVGGAAAGLAILESGIERAQLNAERQACVERYELPPNRLRCGFRVADQRAASACIDLSDGLANAVRLLAEASQTGAEVDAGSIPVDEAARAAGMAAGTDPVSAALSGGEDYELLFAVSPRRRRAFVATTARCGVSVLRIGRLTSTREVCLRRGENAEPLPDGYEHFSAKRH
jgi:thiamine-monophosphate kinase